MDTLLEYLTTPLIQKFSRTEQLRNCLFLILLVTATTLIVDVVSGVPASFVSLLLAALIKSFFYTFGIISAQFAISRFSKKTGLNRGISVGMTWLVSLAGFLVGYLLLAPYRQAYGHLEYHGAGGDFLFFLKITPVWGALTYFFIQFHLKKSLLEQLDQLREVNESLKSAGEKTRTKTVVDNEPSSLPICLPNKEKTKIDPHLISFVEVEEHYCTVHCQEDGKQHQIELKCSLKKMAEALPQNMFILVHRSCIVNLNHIERIEKIPRSYVLYIKNSDRLIKVSRYRISDILPIVDKLVSQGETRISP